MEIVTNEVNGRSTSKSFEIRWSRRNWNMQSRVKSGDDNDAAAVVVRTKF